jgi:uncharacterized protein YjbI with pentapeptide repeats
VVRDEDWGCEDLSGRSWSRHSFLDVDMSETTGRGAVFDGCSFVGVRFNVARHVDSAFTNCVFRGCTFFDTRFDDCKFVGSLFQESTFALLQVHGGDWSFTGLPGADLRKAVFDRVRMREADLTGARLDGASVTSTDLSGAMLRNARFTRADLRGSDLSALDPLHAELSGAIIDPDQAVVVATALGMTVI